MNNASNHACWKRDNDVYVATSVPETACVPAAVRVHAVLNAMCGLEYGMARTRETEYLATSSGLATALSAEDQRRYGYDILERGLNLVPLAWPRNMDAWIEVWGR